MSWTEWTWIHVNLDIAKIIATLDGPMSRFALVRSLDVLESFLWCVENVRAIRTTLNCMRKPVDLVSMLGEIRQGIGV
jgi:hypothetical protein